MDALTLIYVRLKNNMRTQQIKLYNFDELSDEIKEKVLNKFRDINTDFNWHDFLEYEFKEDLKNKGITFDGLNFDLYRRDISLNKPSIEDYKKVISHFADNDIKTQELLKVIEDNDEEINIEIHSNPRGDTTQLYINDEISEKFNDLLYSYLNQLNKEYEFQISDDAIKETLNVNEYEFLENGDIFR